MDEQEPRAPWPAVDSLFQRRPGQVSAIPRPPAVAGLGETKANRAVLASEIIPLALHQT